MLLIIMVRGLIVRIEKLVFVLTEKYDTQLPVNSVRQIYISLSVRITIWKMNMYAGNEKKNAESLRSKKVKRQKTKNRRQRKKT